jgi:Tfp pilus assembly protein PilV
MKITSTHSFPGSTVIEVLIATTLIAFALTGLAMLMTANVKNSSEADYREAAIGLAQDAMEQIKQNKTTMLWSAFTAEPPSTNAFKDSACNTPIVKYNTNFKVLCSRVVNGNKVTATIETCWNYATEPTVLPCPATSKSTKIVQVFYNY